MHLRHALRPLLLVPVALASTPLCAQGTENAIAAAVVFGAVVVGAVLAGLLVTVLYLFRRRPWQRVVVLLFGAALVLTSLWIGSQQGHSGDMQFLQHLLGGSGLLFLGLGAVLGPRRV
jgi:hypothetical protein